MKDFLVLCDGSSADELRISCGESLSARFKGSFDVAAVSALPSLAVIVSDMGGAYIPPDHADQDEALARAATLQAALDSRFRDHEPPVSIYHVCEAPDLLGHRIAQLARSHDLCIATLPQEDCASPIEKSVLDQVLVEGGRSLLCLPGKAGEATGGGDFAFSRICIAWNGTRECARAVAAGMDLIMQAAHVSVVMVDQPLRRAGEDVKPGDDIIRHLARHGVHATLARVTGEEMDTSNALLAEAARLKADMLVMGAQAGGGILQWLRGGATQGIMASSPMPLLMAH